MPYELQDSIENVINFGGWTICKDKNNLLNPLRLAVDNTAHHLMGSGISKSKKFWHRLRGNDHSVRSLFDALNQCTELMQLQHSFSVTHLKNAMGLPSLWTYPNIRVDVCGREQFSAPAHADDWISFRGNKNLVVWGPLFGIGNIEISPFTGKIEIEADDYWGIKVKFPEHIEWKKVQLYQDEFLIFRDDLIHRSSGDFGPNGARITVQLRYEDLINVKTNYVRPSSQTISSQIKIKQKELIARGVYDNSQHI